MASCGQQPPPPPPNPFEKKLHKEESDIEELDALMMITKNLEIKEEKLESELRNVREDLAHARSEINETKERISRHKCEQSTGTKKRKLSGKK
jgi:predicted  nucleic acid-binding Zn-ribbon protein